MKLKQMKNKGGYVWENESGEKCGCMFGQMAIAQNPDEHNIAELEDLADKMADEISHCGVIFNFSDGKRQSYKDIYEKTCLRCQETFPKLDLEFPEWESFQAEQQL